MTEMKRSLATIALHGGQEPDQATRARAVPIYQTTSYVFQSVQQAAGLFALEQSGHIYSRISNPTTEVLERRLAEMEGGSGALAVASGQAAIALAVLNITGAGQNLVSTRYLYGGTYNLFRHTLARLGIEARFVDSSRPDEFARAIDSQTRLLYTEVMGNPRNNVDDFEALAAIAHDHGLPLFIDNTVATPCLFRPFDYGADVVVHSLTKFVGGHGTCLGGAIVESGRFNWGNGKYPEISQPDPSYHGFNYWERAPECAFITRARAQMLRDLGPSISPFSAFLLLQGLETLPLRMKRHCENALAVAQWLRTHPAVAWVNYPGLDSHPDHARAKRYFPFGQGAIIGFGVKGGFHAAVKVIESVRLCSHLANIGDAKTLIIHPASTTHGQLSREERLLGGITDDFIRLSVGLEDPEDIMRDLDQALTK